jgi:hypothetical protein
MDADMLARIDALLEHGQPRVVFIREAIEGALLKREKARALRSRARIEGGAAMAQPHVAFMLHGIAGRHWRVRLLTVFNSQT